MVDLLKTAENSSTAPTLVKEGDRDRTLVLGDSATILSEPGQVLARAVTELQADASFGGRYTLGAQLGEGGMGEVILCKDTRIGRDVAMKIIRAGHGSRSDLAKRFLREARVQGQLEHPAIVPVYDVGRNPAGAAFFTMKRVRGLTLEDILEGLGKEDPRFTGEYTTRKLLTAFGNVCLAVHFAHARGVLHRDLKPANVMLGDFGEVYVLDWGLAKLVEGDDDPAHGPEPVAVVEEAAGKTAHGAIMGTPGYMAPEQIQGETQLIGPATDIYALGSILFELLTLADLHVGGTAQDLLVATLRGSDARPSVRTPERDVPPELEAICVRATALAPSQRYSSAREIHEAIEGYLDGDRDLERRRELAGKHTDIAEAAAQRALTGGPGTGGDRSRALQEAGRAIALDPTNTRAQATLLRLFTTPPQELPPEARDELHASARISQSIAMRIAALSYLSWFLYVPLGMWMGARDRGLAFACESVWLGASLTSFYVYRRPPKDGSTSPWVFVWSSLAVACTTVLFGPFMLLPALAAVNTLALVLTAGHKKGRILAVSLGNLAILVPVAMEWLGILPPSYLFVNNTIVIMPHVLNYPRTPTMVFLLVSNIMSIVTAAVFVSRVRDALNVAQERLVVQSWQLRQLVPHDAKSAMSSPPVPPKPACLT